jgi:hypothetical protein
MEILEGFDDFFEKKYPARKQKTTAVGLWFWRHFF